MCIQQEGRGELGDRYPLFFPAFNRNSGAFHTAPYVYSQALWTKLAGTSPAGFRSFIALVSILTIVGVFFLTSTLTNPTAAWLAALAASISPWLFQFSRIAWDPPLDPMFLVWGLFFFLRSTKWRDAIASGVLLALAVYSYPPARAQIPLFFPSLLLAKSWLQPSVKVRNHLKYALACVATASLITLPLIQKTMSGEIQARAKVVSVFSPVYLINTYGSTSPIGGLRAFAFNFAKHLDPNFLFIRGDQNLRHSTGYTGILSALDALAIALVIVLLIQRRKSKYRGAFLVAVMGFTTGIAAASLTWEGIPHALRSIGGAPFIAVFTGVTIGWASERIRLTRVAAMLTAVAFFTYFSWVYFTRYPKVAGPWFDQQVLLMGRVMQATSGRNEFVRFHRQYPFTGLHYHLMQTFHEPCSSPTTLGQDH
jgi:hypothetical protein